jgi:hypothetical protein
VKHTLQTSFLPSEIILSTLKPTFGDHGAIFSNGRNQDSRRDGEPEINLWYFEFRDTTWVCGVYAQFSLGGTMNFSEAPPTRACYILNIFQDVSLIE